jgi:hypothetical protein
MSSHPLRADQALLEAPAAAALIARLQASREAAKVIAPACAQILPGFDATRPGICDLRSGSLHFLLPSGAHCAKLRQAAPRIAAVLRRNGFEVNEITTTVQPGRIPTSRQAQCMNQGAGDAISSRTSVRSDGDLSNAMGFASKLAHTIPNSRLRQALLALEAACAARLARMRDSEKTLDEQNQRKRDTDREGD